jgi:hypothetical protein
VFATGNGPPFLHHNVFKRVLRRAAVDAGLDGDDRRVRFHDLRHTFASHLIADIHLDVMQVSRIVGHARTSMTLDTYTHLFEEARHGADVRAELAKSEFANLLAHTVEPTARSRRTIGRGVGARRVQELTQRRENYRFAGGTEFLGATGIVTAVPALKELTEVVARMSTLFTNARP